MLTHTDGCAAVEDEECTPLRGVWNQPPGWAVGEAQADLDDDAPWCVIQHAAWELVEESRHD